MNRFYNDLFRIKTCSIRIVQSAFSEPPYSLRRALRKGHWLLVGPWLLSEGRWLWQLLSALVVAPLAPRHHPNDRAAWLARPRGPITKEKEKGTNLQNVETLRAIANHTNSKIIPKLPALLLTLLENRGSITLHSIVELWWNLGWWKFGGTQVGGTLVEPRLVGLWWNPGW